MKKLLYLAIFIVVLFCRKGLVSAQENCDKKEGKCDAHSRTRRRAPSTPKSCAEGSKTPQQAENILDSYKDTFQLNSFNREDMKNKSNFVKAARDLIPAMCKNMTVGGSPLTASSSLYTWIHVQRKPCNETTSSLSEVPCQNCSKVGKYKVMEDVLANNSQWNCTQNSNNASSCEGVCIGSVRMRDDLLSNSSSICSSNVIDVQIFNPTTSTLVHPHTSQTVMSIQLEFDKGDRQNLSSNFKCALWRDDIKRWDSSPCTLMVVLKKQGQNRTLANCNCTSLGSVCIVPTGVAGGGDDKGGDGKGNGDGDGESKPTQTIAPSQTVTTTNSQSGTATPGQRGTAASRQSETTIPGQSVTTSPTQSVATSSTQSGTTASTESGTTVPTESGTNASSLAPTSSSEVPGNNGKLQCSITYPGDCQSIIKTNKKQELINQTTETVVQRLSVGKSQIKKVNVTCGSIIITFTITGLNSSTLDEKKNLFNSMISSNGLVINFADGTKLVPSKAGIGVSVDNLTYINPTQATVPPTTRERFELEFDYRPLMFTMAFVILAVVLCICVSCIVHSYWLKKEKFTKYNSMTPKEYEKKMKEKEDKDRMKEVEEVPMAALGTSRKVAPTNYEMSHETMPKINERNFTNYHWAQTSFVPPPGIETEPESPDAPKLILDDSESDSDGEDNKGYESDGTKPVPRAVSHLSLAKDKNVLGSSSSDSMSNIVHPLYENIDNEEHLYDSIKER